MNDITSKADVEQLVRTFYERLLKDDDMHRVFQGLDFEEHVPKIVHFWSFVLLDETGYTTNVFEKHLHLPIQLPQFDVWLEVFIATVNDLFAGEKAEMAKQRATVLAFTFKSKWAKVKNQ